MKRDKRGSAHFPSRGHDVTRRYVLTGALAVAAGGVTWWLAWPKSDTGETTTDSHGDQIQTMPRGSLPEFARSGGSEVEQVYRFAVEQGEALESIPCFCGCAKIGHRQNRDCYIKSLNRDGTVTYTSHGSTWTLCLDITRDVMRLKDEGKPLAQIRDFIDQRYGRYGPATPTPPPRA